MSKTEIRYLSTADKAEPVTFLSAMKKGLADDGGLYIPDHWPDLSRGLWSNISGKTLFEIGTEIAHTFIPQLSVDELGPLVNDAFTFDAPLVHLHDQTYVLELFHGPTLAFKDFGARFMARMMSYEAEKQDQKIIILVATSGDTGSAVGKAFEGVKGVEVCLLYPGGQVSKLQEQQLTTIGGNVTALEVEGTFDECQQLVKNAFTDDTLEDELTLSSANSINIARLLPQMFYYGRALAQLEYKESVHFCVPSGNFGNLTAGMMAAKTGMPSRQFIAGTNINDVVPRYLEDGNFSPKPSKRTISSAMDVGDPSNLERIRKLYSGQEELGRHLWAASFDDDETKETIKKVYTEYDYLLDPHTAVGYLAAGKYRKEQKTDAPAVILSTAHPAKFSDIVEPLINREIILPEALQTALKREKKSVDISADFTTFKEFLLEKYAKL